MKKSAALLAFLLSALVFSGTAYAKLEVAVTPETVSVGSGRSASYTIHINNAQSTGDKIKIQINGPHLEWVQNSYFFIDLQPMQEMSLPLKLYPTGDKLGEFTFSVFAVSLETRKGARDTFRIKVLPPIDIKDFSAKKSGDTLSVKLEITSTQSWDSTAVFEVFDTENSQIAAVSVPFKIEKNKVIARDMGLPENLLAGTYRVRTRIEGTDKEETVAFEIPVYRKVSEATKTVVSPLYKEVTIYLTNNGNTPEVDFKVKKEVRPDMTAFIVDTKECVTDETGRILCDYTISRIEPGETALVTYRIDYWPTFAWYGIAIIIVALIGIISLKRVTRPSLKKTFIRRSGNKHTVMLEVRNPFMKNINNVMLRDWVSPLAHVLHDEFESIMPVVRRSEAGTELIWKIGDMKPKETRHVSYKITPRVGGSLKMPRAYIRYKDQKGNSIRSFSKALVTQ